MPLSRENGVMMDGNVQNMVASLMSPDFQMNGNRQHYLQTMVNGCPSSLVWAKKKMITTLLLLKTPYQATTPQIQVPISNFERREIEFKVTNRVLSFSGASSLHSSRLKRQTMKAKRSSINSL